MVFVVVINILIGFMLSMRPLVLAPAIDAFSATRAEPALGFSDLTLNNIGPTLLHSVGIGYDDVMYIAIMIIVLFMSITILLTVSGLMAQKVLVRMKSMITHDMMKDIHRHILSLPLSFFSSQKTGDLVSRITQDVAKTSNSIDIFSEK